MKYIKNLHIPFQGKRDHTMTTVAIIGGLAVGAAIAALFATKKGRSIKKDWINKVSDFLKKQDTQQITDKLGNLVADVRDHVQQSAENLLGPANKRADTSAINVKAAGTKAWKENKEKVVFPENKPSVN